MNAAEMREYARRLVADWPPLTAEQRIRIAVLFRTETVGQQPCARPARSNKAA